MNSSFIIQPFEGIGIFSFGTSRADIRMILSENYIEKDEQDFYPSLGIFIEYDNEECCHIELIARNSILFNGKILVQCPILKLDVILMSYPTTLILKMDSGLITLT
ncbi:MAG: hypothetical protein ACI80H_001757 [Pseudoalteromonas distincta]